MRGAFDHGDLLLVNAAINTIEHDGIYVMQRGEDMLVRRVQRRDGHWLLISDNSQYPPEVVSASDRGRYAVLGRVVFAWRCAAL